MKDFITRKQRMNRPNNVSIVLTIITIIAMTILAFAIIDLASAFAWVVSGQTPNPEFNYLGKTTLTILSK